MSSNIYPGRSVTKLDRCRQRVQQETLGHRGRSDVPLYGIRRVARTRAGLLTEKQRHRLAKVFADDRHVAFEVTWSLCQSVIDAYQAEQPAEGKKIIDPAHHQHPELRGTARGFQSIVNYVARCLLDAGGFRPLIHSLL